MAEKDSTVPLYVYRCPFCLTERDEFRKVAERDDAPECHRRKMDRVLKAAMVSVFTPYTTVAHDKETGKPMQIRTRDDHRAFLARNGYEEVGNDKSMAPLDQEEFKARRAQKLKEEQVAREQPAFEFDEATHAAT